MWEKIETAPHDGTPVIVYCPRSIDRPGYIDPPGIADNVTIAWVGYANPDQPRQAQWVCVDVVVDTFQGSEWTGSWNEYEFLEINPTHWMPLPGIPEEPT